MHYRPIRSQLKGELKGLVGVRSQVNPKDVAWVGLLCHGAVRWAKNNLEKKKRTYIWDEAKQTRKIVKCLKSTSVYSGFTREGEWKKSASENVKIMKRNKKQMSLLHRKSKGMAWLIWSVRLWLDYSQSVPHIRLRCHYNIFMCTFTSA